MEDDSLHKNEGIDLAYEFVLPSYEWALQTLDVATKRIENLLTFSAGLAFGLPVVAAAIAPTANTKDPLFIAGLVVFGAIALTGLLGRRWAGTIQLISPTEFVNETTWLRMPQADFKVAMLKAASRDELKNAIAGRRRHAFADAMTLLLVVQASLFAVWLSSSL